MVYYKSNISKNNLLSDIKFYKHVCNNDSGIWVNFQIHQTTKINLIWFSFFSGMGISPTRKCWTYQIPICWTYQMTRKWKNQISRKITNCYAQNFTNVFERVVRTSVSIFRSIRPQKPILFDFHFFGFENFTAHCIYSMILHWDLVRKKCKILTQKWT